MKPGVYRFKTLEEQNRWEIEQRIKDGIPYWEWDRYEYARLHTTFKPGIYKFRDPKEKRTWEFNQVVKAWKKQK